MTIHRVRSVGTDLGAPVSSSVERDHAVPRVFEGANWRLPARRRGLEPGDKQHRPTFGSPDSRKFSRAPSEAVNLGHQPPRSHPGVARASEAEESVDDEAGADDPEDDRPERQLSESVQRSIQAAGGLGVVGQGGDDEQGAGDGDGDPLGDVAHDAERDDAFAERDRGEGRGAS